MADDLIVRPLAPEILADYLTFFDRDAFTDNPHWASCYCYFNHFPHPLGNWEQRTAAENRQGASELIRAGRMRGYLAYLDGQVVAWCNAAPRAWMTTLDDDPQAAEIGAIVCFIVAKAYRGKGIARRLLEAACDGFRSQGMRIAEAYPRRQAHGEASNYHGPLGMYLAAGFEPYHEEEGIVTVRKRLS
jgi:GNAT superfamily N-acetyltransferase